jgi:uncharacterized protein (DUF433 family)
LTRYDVIRSGDRTLVLSRMNEQVPYQISRSLYSFSETDRLAGAVRGTTRRWIEGYGYQRRGYRVLRPPVTPGTGGESAASFLDLVEVVAISGLRRLKFSLHEIRAIVANCQEILAIERPLATLRFKTGGQQIFVAKANHLLEVGRHKRQTAWNEILAPFLDDLDYAGDWVERWWPLGRDIPVVIDPEFGFGLPVIAGSGVRTEIIYERVRAGDLPEVIAGDFNVSPLEVHRAIQFEASRAA